jgi:RNA polymerase sigma-70 factor (ECF subfamily)
VSTVFEEAPGSGDRKPEEPLSSIRRRQAPSERAADSARTGPLDLRAAFFENAPRIRRFIERLGATDQESEDLLAETFLRAHLGRDRFDSERPVLPWLFGIAANVARDHRRRRFNWRRLIERLRGQPIETLDQERSILAQEDKDRVRAALQRMPERKRVLLVMREFEELGVPEIAQALGMPEATVYSALHYARREFARCYRQLLALEAR